MRENLCETSLVDNMLVFLSCFSNQEEAGMTTTAINNKGDNQAILCATLCAILYLRESAVCHRIKTMRW